MAKVHRPDGLEVKVRFCLYVFKCCIMNRVVERGGEGELQAFLTPILDTGE